jgi:cysteine synthase A
MSTADAAGRAQPAAERIRDSVLEAIGSTPLVRLHRLPKEAGCGAEILAKLESFNPTGSVKDRIAKSMIEAAEKDGALAPGTVVIEATSGNTGVALAFACAAKGHRLILVMPDGAPDERRRLFRFFGAKVELTPAKLGMRGAIERAETLARELPQALVLRQFTNPANPRAHERTTAEEIWRDCGAKLDAVVSAVGTGGTLSGIARALKPRLPDLRIVAVEPADSAVLSGGLAGPHKIQGIGAGFVPQTLERDLIDEVIAVRNVTAFATARRAAALEGIGAGISSGAALAAALELGSRPAMTGKRIVVLLPSLAERYISSELFHDL